MSGVQIYLDESGDFGWTLDKPHQKGGSSRFLTLAAAVVPQHKSHLLAKIVRDIYKTRKRPLAHELKSVDLSAGERKCFVDAVIKLKIKHPEILFISITVNKCQVNDGFRANANGLYNYITKLLLCDTMSQYTAVEFIPDARSLKSSYKHSLHQYLEQMLLEKTVSMDSPNTNLRTMPADSQHNLELQFADILASLFWARHEYKNDTIAAMLPNYATQKTLFFTTE